MAVSHQICNATKANAKAASSAQPFWSAGTRPSALAPSKRPPDRLQEPLLREEQ